MSRKIERYYHNPKKKKAQTTRTNKKTHTKTHKHTHKNHKQQTRTHTHTHNHIIGIWHPFTHEKHIFATQSQVLASTLTRRRWAGPRAQQTVNQGKQKCSRFARTYPQTNQAHKSS